MVSRKRPGAREKYRRYKAKEGAYAAIISPNFYKLGQITDISMGGLSFKYIASDNAPEDVPTQKEYSISLTSMGCCVESLLVNIISDHEVTNTPSFSSLKIKNMHVQFTDLNLTQWLDLDKYMKNNVAEKVENLPPATRS